jgi:hypothetical protein
MKRILYGLGIGALAACIAGGCSNSNSGSKNNGPDVGAVAPPGDHFFDSAATAIGADAGAPGSFRLAVLTFDPNNAANHAAGTPGSNPKIQEAAGSVLAPSGQTISLDGTWTVDGVVSLQGGGWTLQGTIVGTVIMGSFQGSLGAGVFAGADITAGQVGMFFGSQGDAAFDVVVTQGGPVTGIIGGASGGFITGTASGTALSYSWQANGDSGTGSGTVGAGGQLSGTSQQSGCTPLSWGCVLDSGGCTCLLGTFDGGAASACAGLSCCEYQLVAGGGECECFTQAALNNQPCANVALSTDGWMLTSMCPLPAVATPSNCMQDWQATPAPPSPWADYAGTCAAGNLAACTPPPGGCACPAQQGCQTCGKISACCLQ